jgi:hypothetical protein
MKRTIVLTALTIVFIQVCQPKAQISHPRSQNLIFEAIVKKIGSAPGVGSGFHAVYQLAKYKVLSVCEGEYDQQEIVVDHLMLYGNELDDLRVGDKVRVVTKKSETIFTRNNEEGFRNAGDKVEFFYTGEKPILVTPNCVSCEPCN